MIMNLHNYLISFCGVPRFLPPTSSFPGSLQRPHGPDCDYSSCRYPLLACPDTHAMTWISLSNGHVSSCLPFWTLPLQFLMTISGAPPGSSAHRASRPRRPPACPPACPKRYKIRYQYLTQPFFQGEWLQMAAGRIPY